MKPVRVLAVTSELFPLVKTGGLADVTGALPKALAAEGVAATTLLPGYPAVLAALSGTEIHFRAELFGGPARLLRGQAAGVDLLVIDAPHLYARPGGPYAAPNGQDWPDNAQRFAALGKIAAWIGQGGLPGLSPDILHAHDWQAGLALAYLRYGPAGRSPGTVMTVHNLAFQGMFPAALLYDLELPSDSFTMDGVEFYGGIGFLKAGLALADRITTVSPSYAAEIQTPEFGMGLDGLLRGRAGVLHGILNGIDDAVWDPAVDRLLPAPFDAANPTGRAANKAAVQARFGLDAAPERLLFGVVSRLTWQKGLDLLLGCLDEIIGLGAQLAVLGTGEPALEAGFAAAAASYPGQIGCVIGYDETLAHRMQAGVDALLVPSRFEPCGLTQLCALRYGAIPVVARVGGLADTVIDANEAAIAAGAATGIQFPAGTLAPALRRTADLWQRPAIWRQLQANAMQADVSWRRPAARYAALYRQII
jgi:starch synthase